MKYTIKEFAAKMKIEYPMAASLLKLMLIKGEAKIVDKISAGKGKPTLVYEVPDSFTIQIK